MQHATLMVRPRGWHLPEKHILVDGQTASGALMDFAIFFFNSAHALIKSGSGKLLLEQANGLIDISSREMCMHVLEQSSLQYA